MKPSQLFSLITLITLTACSTSHPEEPMDMTLSAYELTLTAGETSTVEVYEAIDVNVTVIDESVATARLNFPFIEVTAIDKGETDIRVNDSRKTLTIHVTVDHPASLNDETPRIEAPGILHLRYGMPGVFISYSHNDATHHFVDISTGLTATIANGWLCVDGVDRCTNLRTVRQTATRTWLIGENCLVVLDKSLEDI